MGLAISLVRVSVSRSSASTPKWTTRLQISAGRNRAMRFVRFLKKNIAGLVIGKPKRRSLPLICLASAESLTVPCVQVVELRAEMGCAQCQKRLARVLSKMGGKTVAVTCRVPAARASMTKVAPTVSSCSKSGNDGRRIILLPPCN
ncbi:hypothetical protein ACLOJK_034559 [Asimina triloba]